MENSDPIVPISRLQRVGVVFGMTAAGLTAVSITAGIIAFAVSFALGPVNNRIRKVENDRVAGDSVIVNQISTLARAMSESNKGRRDLLLEMVRSTKPLPVNRGNE